MTRGRAGLTLVELVAAVGVLVVAVLAALGTIASGEAANSQARERGQALLAAQRRLAEVVAAPWDALPAQDGAQFDVTMEVAPGRSAPLRRADGGPAGVVAVRASAHPDLRRVSVSVRWRTASGGPDATVSLVTLVARRS